MFIYLPNQINVNAEFQTIYESLSFQSPTKEPFDCNNKKTINKIWLQLYQVPIFWNKIESLATKLQEHQHVIATFA